MEEYSLYTIAGAIGLILGKLHHIFAHGKETYYLVGIDLDNKAAIDKITTINGIKKSLEAYKRRNDS